MFCLKVRWTLQGEKVATKYFLEYGKKGLIRIKTGIAALKTHPNGNVIIRENRFYAHLNKTYKSANEFLMGIEPVIFQKPVRCSN